MCFEYLCAPSKQVTSYWIPQFLPRTGAGGDYILPPQLDDLISLRGDETIKYISVEIERKYIWFTKVIAQIRICQWRQSPGENTVVEEGDSCKKVTPGEITTDKITNTLRSTEPRISTKSCFPEGGLPEEAITVPSGHGGRGYRRSAERPEVKGRFLRDSWKLGGCAVPLSGRAPQPDIKITR